MAESQAKGAEVKSYNQLQGFPGMLSACLQETLSHQVSNLLLVVTSWPSHGFHGPVYTNVDLGVYRVTPRTIFYSPTWEADAMVPRANNLPTRRGFPLRDWEASTLRDPDDIEAMISLNPPKRERSRCLNML